MIPNILNEKNASRIIDNPFFVKYVKTLKNNSWCFFLEEYINGVTLSELFQTVKLFGSITFCSFHAACVLIMLETLNKLGIVHRNIKPENIILTKIGYPKLIDFSCCKIIESNRTRTLVGTPFYISPEVLKGAGYSYSCDYWGLGVLLYYMFFGEYPFGTRSSPPDKVYEEIINKKLIFSENLLKKFNNNSYKAEKINELREVIEILLNKNETERMKNVENIKNKKFFENIDFDKLTKMEIKAPYIPQINTYDYQKKLKNTSKPFMDFRPEPAIKLKSSVNDAAVIFREKKENYLEYHKNLMRWFEKF
jgi:cGMP-dependent protein kinase